MLPPCLCACTQTGVKKIGPELIVGRLWRELGLPEVLKRLLSGRRYEFEVERAIYFTVLSRLFFPGSDRKALRVSRDYKIEGKEAIDLHHLYRAMAWLGDVKDEVEEGLFLRNRDLFTELNLVYLNPDEAEREAIIESLREKLKEGAKALIGNRGYRRYLKIEKESTIKGHVFCSFLALVVMKELIRRIDFKTEWDEIRQDIDALYEVEIEHEGKRYLLRSPLQGSCGKVLKAVGVAVPPSVTEAKT